METAGQRQDWTSVTGREWRARRGSARRLREAPDPADSERRFDGKLAASAGHGVAAPPNAFEILRGSGVSTPFLAPLGIDDDGRAIWVDLHHPASGHVLIEGGSPTARGEILRALAIGLAMTTRPALLQVTAIDATGRDLTVLETLPHAVTETAGDARSAQINLLWLEAELLARVSEGRRWPDMLLVVDDLMSLAGPESGRGRAALMRILRSGGAWGMHVLGAAPSRMAGLRAAGWSGPEVARLVACDHHGWFEYRCGGRSTRLAGVSLAAVDLDGVARGRRPAASALGRFPPVRPAPAGWRPNA
ncbi:MAG TPA: FtsK/SpoIIIE domain-containing protein [Anaerolineales bacterium]|nr:FtsK/SpoIIIE domain-containing protein [Anaerolineales bacterium]